MRNYIRNIHPNPPIIKTFIKKGTDALELVKYAETQINKYNINFSAGEQVWCVLDVDDKTDEQLQNAFIDAGKHNIKMALSNPSFELWYLLHFIFTTAFFNNCQLISDLKKHIPNYVKNRSIFDKIKDITAAALRNAELLELHHIRNTTVLPSRNSNPSTMVYKLVNCFFPLNTG